ncbi:YbaK/EbsC family protein [Halorarum salinum]|uniref:YbaK/EbsC family protein n=1 Tax=Halorarum salinum TaxID=2743089 RepID=A0A7D5QLT4_9EURY|nr:YbaK/EbsC family protein [Halobaculum salinum]QLG62985.1 YbaK/EbsC family protein [Halobaculum salinum]
MHPTADRFATRTHEELGFEARIEEFPEGTKTARDAAAAVGCDVGQIVKSLVFLADGEPIVVLTAGDNRVDEDRLAAELDADAVGTAGPEEVKSATGWSIGGVPPFLHETDVPVYLDGSLRSHERIWAAAGTPSAVFALEPDELERFADPTPVDAFDGR